MAYRSFEEIGKNSPQTGAETDGAMKSLIFLPPTKSPLFSHLRASVVKSPNSFS